MFYWHSLHVTQSLLSHLLICLNTHAHTVHFGVMVKLFMLVEIAKDECGRTLDCYRTLLSGSPKHLDRLQNFKTMLLASTIGLPNSIMSLKIQNTRQLYYPLQELRYTPSSYAALPQS